MTPRLKMSMKHALHRGTLLLMWATVLVLIAAQVLPVSAASGCPEGKRCLFVPAILGGAAAARPSAVDLIAAGVEVNQAIQNESNSVPLVAGRGTVLRIFSNASGYTQAVTGVRISISASREGNVLTSTPTVVSATIPLHASRGDLQSSVNFNLPAQWLSGTVDLTIRIDSDNRVEESDENNNTITQRLVFNNVPALNVKIVPIQYAHNAAGSVHTYPAPTTDSISDWVLRTFPVSQVNISWHAPYAFSGNLSNSSDFHRLLNEITALKSSESAPSSTVYYALVPTRDGNFSWFYGGIAGIGWVGNRVSVGIDLAGSASHIAAHEIGHNLGMGHTPCGVSGSEANFPYSDGSIGQYGVDIISGTLYTPSSKDIMSYCNPKWISDYTYKMLYNAQMKYGVYEIPSSQNILPESHKNTLMVRANIRGGSVEMLPSYFFSNQQTENTMGGAYTVQIVGADGMVIAEHPVQATAIEVEAEEALEGIHTMVPAPDAPVTAVRLLKGGTVIAEQPVIESQQTLLGRDGKQVNVEPAAEGFKVQWDGANIPSLVRYSVDGGATWTTLGVDVTGGQMNVSNAMVPGENAIFQVIPAYAASAPSAQN